MFDIYIHRKSKASFDFAFEIVFLLLKNIVDLKINKRFHLRLACGNSLKNEAYKCDANLIIYDNNEIAIKIPAKRQRAGPFKNFSLPTIMSKDRITAFGCRQKPFLLVSPFVPCSIILLLQLNTLFLQLNRSKLQLSAHFLQLNAQNLQLNVKHKKYPLD